MEGLEEAKDMGDKPYLIKCGIDKYYAYMWGNTRQGYWRIADSYILHRAISI